MSLGPIAIHKIRMFRKRIFDPVKSIANIDREIIRLAIPNIISNISVPLLSTVDTALMGHLSTAHLGAIGIASMIFNFLYWNFGFLRMGTTGLTAQAFGRKDAQEIIAVPGRAFLLVLIIGVLLILFQKPLGELGGWLMNVTSDQRPLMLEYFYIRIWAAPAALGLYVLMGWYFGMQNAIIPLVLTLLTNAVNIGLSMYLTLELNMGIRGVAWGTVVAQYVAFMVGLLLLIKYKSYFIFFKWKVVRHFDSFWHFLLINKDIFLRTVALSLVFAFFYSYSSTHGELYLAINVIMMQFMNWMSYGLDGLAFAAESLVGKYYGMQDLKMGRLAIRKIFIWSGVFALGYSLLYAFGYTWIVDLFTNDISLKKAIKPYSFWLIILPIIGVASYVWDGVFIGLTAAKSMRNSMALSMLAFALTIGILQYVWPLHGLWVALMVFLLSRGIVQTRMFVKWGFEMK